MAGERERFEMLLEEIRDKVQFIAEGHGVLQSQIAGLQEQMGDMQNQMGGMQSQLTGMQSQIRNLDNKIDKVHSSLKATFYALNEKIDEHIKQPAHGLI
ncbi:MAG: hypothetical protein WCV91_02450 [Candidatus Margulisiibacteriota bacterium]